MKSREFFHIECTVDNKSLKFSISINLKLILFVGSIASIVALILFIKAG